MGYHNVAVKQIRVAADTVEFSSLESDRLTQGVDTGSMSVGIVATALASLHHRLHSCSYKTGKFRLGLNKAITLRKIYSPHAFDHRRPLPDIGGTDVVHFVGQVHDFLIVCFALLSAEFL